MNARMKLIGLLSLAIAATWVGIASAHPLPGQQLKFGQEVMNGTPINGAQYFGHDEWSTAYREAGTPAYRGRFMADDFADTLSTPVVHVQWWGSYFNNIQNPAIPVTKFLIAFEKDQPVGPNNPLTFSHPIPPIHSEIVTLGAVLPGSGTYSETPVGPGGPPLNEALFEYNAELKVPFPQKANEVYWLKIVALVDLPAGVQPTDPGVTRWGWHNRDYTIQNPTASPVPLPGEHNQGTAANPIWHFQDNSVEGLVQVFTTINTAGVQVVQQVDQPISQMTPQHYMDFADGPQGISNFSKDLAFKLYTVVPEPASWGLMAAGLFGIAIARRMRMAEAARRSRGTAQVAA